MKIQDFCKYFTNVQICRIFKPDKFLKQIFEGEFKKGSTSGGYLKPEESPQYFLSVEKKTEFCISVMQSDKRLISNYKKENICHGLKIYKSNGEMEVGNGICFESLTCSWDREIQLQISLDAGDYIIMPHTAKSGMESKFWLRIYGDQKYSIQPLHPKALNTSPLNGILLKCFEGTEGNESPVNEPKKETKEICFVECEGIQLSKDRLTISNSLNEKRIVNCFSSKPFHSGKYFFSVKIEKTTESNIILGFCREKLHSKCLIHLKDSFGYYSFNGASYLESGSFEYGSPFGQGDQIGISLNMDTREVEYFLNGKSLGMCFNNIKSNLYFYVSLYSPGDSVILNPKAKLNSSNSNQIGIIREGERIALKTHSNMYLTMSSNKIKLTNGLHLESMLKISFENEKFKFQNSNGKFLSIGDEIHFKVKELNDSSKNGYLFQTKNGDFLCIENDQIKTSQNSLKKETRLFPILIEDSEVYQEFKENDVIVIKSRHDFFVGFSNGTFKSHQTVHEDCKFLLKKSGDYFMLLSSNKETKVEVNKECLFFFIQEKGGYSIECSSELMSSSSEGFISWGESLNIWDSRFQLQKISSLSILKTKNRIAFKSLNSGLYLYYNEKNKPVAGKFHPTLSTFTIGLIFFFKILLEQEDDGFKFKNVNNVYLVTKKQNKLFNVNLKEKFFTLESGGFYLSVLDEKVYVLKRDDKKESWFELELQ
jgi:hypothetical protein